MHRNDIDLLVKSVAAPEPAWRVVSKYSFRLILSFGILIRFRRYLPQH